jgi:hypothetical protein
LWLNLQKRQVYNQPLFLQDEPVFTMQHYRLAHLPPGILLFAACVSPALPQRRSVRWQLREPARPDPIFNRHWR